MRHSTPTRPASSRRLPLALVAAWLCAACGGAPEVRSGEGRVERLALAPVGPLPPDEQVVVAHLTPTRKTWVVEASNQTRLFLPVALRIRGESPNEEVPTEPAIKLEGERGESKRLIVPGPFEPSTFNRVVVRMIHYGQNPELTRLVLRRKGRPDLASPWLSVPGKGPPPEAVLFEFPELRRIDGTIEELALETRGAVDLTAVLTIDLIHLPELGFLPPHDAPRLVSLDGEERRARGLSSACALEAEIEVPPGGELDFSYGVDDRLLLPRQEATLVCTVTPEEGEPLVERLSLSSGGWRASRLDLEDLGGQRARVRFEIEADGGEPAYALLAEPRAVRRGSDAPTVLLVTSDTHRADHLSKAGDLVRTPVLDALADRGIFFSNAYASTNVTNPSHVALMTGTTPRDTRILNNTTPLAGEASTLAEAFGAAGYRTFAAVSAFHLRDPESGLGQGFDRMNGPTRGERSGEETLEVLEDWLEDAAGEPTFVWLHLFDAHAPYVPPKPYRGRYWDDGNPYDPERPLDMPPIKEDPKATEGIEIPGFLKGIRDKDFPYQEYRAEVDYVDFVMGKVLEIERLRDGVIAFTSDHGESFGEHGVWWDHAELYPETVAVPMILAWPDGPRGEVVDDPVEHIDIARTLLDIAGLYEAEFPGRNLGWALDSTEDARPRYMISAHGNTASVQSGRWKLILHLRSHHEWALERRRNAHEVELYDLEADPGCLVDLVKEPAHKETARGLRRDLIEWLARAPAQGLGTSRLQSESSLASLEELGYADSGAESSAGAPLYVEDPENEWCRFFDE